MDYSETYLHNHPTLYRCVGCGALVLGKDKKKHTEFHERIGTIAIDASRGAMFTNRLA